MKLFENKVGRPSNEVKKNRRIFVVSMITLGAVLLTLGVSFLVNINSDRLKGAASEKPATTAFDDMNFYRCIIDNYNEQKGTKLSYKTKLTNNQLNSISDLFCDSRGITSVKGLEKLTNLRNFTASSNRINKINISQNTDLKKLYLAENKLEYINLNKNKNLAHLELGGNELKSIDLTKNENLELLNLTSSLLKNLDLSKNINLSELYLQFMNFSDLNLDNNKHLRELTILSNSKLRTLNLVQNISLKKLNLVNDSALENVYLDVDLDKNRILVDDNDKNREDYGDYMNSIVGNNIINIIGSPKVKMIPITEKLELECPATAFIGEKITCKTNSTKSIIRVSKSGLSDNYLNIFKKYGDKVTTQKKVVNLMYTKKGYAKVVAEQSGSNSVTRIIEIKEKDGLILKCPNLVHVGKKFTCTTNSTKATVRVSKEGLSDNYLSIFKKYGGKITTQKKVVNLMYMEEGYAKIVAELNGYKSVTKTVKIVK